MLLRSNVITLVSHSPRPLHRKQDELKAESLRLIRRAAPNHGLNGNSRNFLCFTARDGNLMLLHNLLVCSCSFQVCGWLVLGLMYYVSTCRHVLVCLSLVPLSTRVKDPTNKISEGSSFTLWSLCFL